MNITNGNIFLKQFVNCLPLPFEPAFLYSATPLFPICDVKLDSFVKMTPKVERVLGPEFSQSDYSLSNTSRDRSYGYNSCEIPRASGDFHSAPDEVLSYVEVILLQEYSSLQHSTEPRDASWRTDTREHHTRPLEKKKVLQSRPENQCELEK